MILRHTSTMTKKKLSQTWTNHPNDQNSNGCPCPESDRAFPWRNPSTSHQLHRLSGIQLYCPLLQMSTQPSPSWGSWWAQAMMNAQPLPTGTTCETLNHTDAQAAPQTWASKELWRADLTLRLGGGHHRACNTIIPPPCPPAPPADSTVAAQILAQLYAGCDSGQLISPPASIPICKRGHYLLASLKGQSTGKNCRPLQFFKTVDHSASTYW